MGILSIFQNLNPVAVLGNTLFGSDSYSSRLFRLTDAVAKTVFVYLTLAAYDIYKTQGSGTALQIYEHKVDPFSLCLLMKNAMLTGIIALGIINIPAHIWNGNQSANQPYNTFFNRVLLTGLIFLTTYSLYELVPKISPETTLSSSLSKGFYVACWAIENVAWPVIQTIGQLAGKICESAGNLYQWACK